ncbi:hypothetical protein VTN49DRAFT_4775 [Thermomyces lanuginosus]|uniref:uncharacterized protein n=1 Tax=Thermomyces lanuginosus TaxID=5541 RepID=UPI003743D207
MDSESVTVALRRMRLEDRGGDPQSEETDVSNTEYESQSEEEEIAPFRFFDLPSEIRLKIYEYVFFRSNTSNNGVNGNVGASSKQNRILAPRSHRLSLLLASRRLHDEAAALFYSTQIFRVFPIQDYSRMPTLASLAPTYRPLVRKIELILGSSWTKPPKSWRVTRRLGLRELTGVETLKVFVQCDPSHPVFEGFRISTDFYTNFAGDLLRGILQQLPKLENVEFDAWPSVQKDGSLMSRLLAEARAAGKKILWGPERGWSDMDDYEKRFTVPSGNNEPQSTKLVTPLRA